MRFTAAEKARNPDPDFIRRLLEGFEIPRKQGIEMRAQLARDDVFRKLLLNEALVVRRVHLDDAVDIAVNVPLEDFLNFHIPATSL